MIAFADAPLFHARRITKWLVGTLVPKPGTVDEFAVALPSGRHLAVTPEGNYEDRDPGSFGPYETVKVRNNNLIVHYEWTEGLITYAIPFIGDL